MATKMTLTREKAKAAEPKVYEIIREHKKEREKIMSLEKELKAHEKTDMSHAHPMHSPSATAHQSQAPLPSMRK
jgi:hypothetical protein